MNSRVHSTGVLSRIVVSRLLARHCLGVLLMTCSSAVVRAQADAGPMVLRIPASARASSMANTGLTSSDADALFYNPALLFNARGMSVSMQRYGSFGTAGALANIATVGSMNIGVGAQVLNWSAAPLSYREITRLGATALGDSGGVPASSIGVTLGIAKNIRGHRLGLSAKYVADRFAATQDGTLAFDVGLMGPSLGPGNLTFVVQNIGQGLRIGGAQGKLPTRAGAGWADSKGFEKFDLGVQAQVTVDRDGYTRPAVGGEIGYVPIEGVALVARAGLRLPRETDESFGTGGLGITIDRISLDYAIEPFLNGRSVSHRLGLRIK
ncbi:MAG: hypothetical protein ABJB74_15825 [Gemmatimonas sp.]